MEIIIDKNVPLLRVGNYKNGASKYKFEQMVHGDSFFIEDEESVSDIRLSAKERKRKLNARRDAIRGKIWSSFRHWKQIAGFNGHLATRHVTEGSREGLRIWFLKD
tara:strand:- start:7018 stop:7335 length:318 start_codon:yes stop_codon:yes gene_type:complete